MSNRASLLLLVTLAAGCGTSEQAAVTGSASSPVASSAPEASLVVAQNGEIVELDGQGRSVRVLTSGFQDDSPAFSPDGATLVFSRVAGTRAKNGDGRSELIRMSADGTAKTTLTGTLPVSAQDPAWTPDGSQIVFAGENEGDSDLYLINADGTGLKHVTTGPGDDRRPTFSPDGRTLYFQRASQVYSVPVSGGAATLLAEGAFPQYAPGEALLYSRGGDLWTSRDGRESRVTHNSPAHEFLGQASSDSIYALAGEGLTAEPKGDVYLMDADGSHQTRLTTGLRASSLTVSALGRPVPDSSPSPSPIPGVPLTVVNNSSVTMYVYVFGLSGGVQSYLNASGTVSTYSSGTIPAVASVASNTTSTPIQMPTFTRGRIYFSSNPNLQFTAYQTPPSLASTTELYDFVEYNYASVGDVFTADTTCVEAFALPFQINTSPAGTVNGLTLPSGMGAGNRTAVFDAINKLGAPWTNLIVGNNTRLVAPWNGYLLNPPFPTNYLDSAIAAQWGGNLTINTYLQNPTQYYTATAVNAGTPWVFTPVNGSGATITYNQPPTTAQAFNCTIPYSSTDTALYGPRVTAILAAGLNRGTLLYPNPSPSPIPFTLVTAGQPDYNTADFYKASPNPSPPQVAAVNEYSKILHQQSLNGYQYGIASDDEGSQSSTITVNSGITSFTVTIQSF